MKEYELKDCIENNSVKVINPDFERAKSLIEVAQERINLISNINEKNCNFVFEDYYTSLIEILQSQAFKMGFNILNHLCLGFFLRDIIKEEKLFNIFDDLRYKRNSLTYYGNKMEFAIANIAIQDCKNLIIYLSKQQSSNL